MLRLFRRLGTSRIDIPSEKSLVSMDFEYPMVEGYTSSDDWKTNMHHGRPKLQLSKVSKTWTVDRQIPRAAVGSIIGVEPWPTVDQPLQVDMVESGPVGLGSFSHVLGGFYPRWLAMPWPKKIVFMASR